MPSSVTRIFWGIETLCWISSMASQNTIEPLLYDHHGKVSTWYYELFFQSRTNSTVFLLWGIPTVKREPHYSELQPRYVLPKSNFCVGKRPAHFKPANKFPRQHQSHGIFHFNLSAYNVQSCLLRKITSPMWLLLRDISDFWQCAILYFKPRFASISSYSYQLAEVLNSSNSSKHLQKPLCVRSSIEHAVHLDCAFVASLLLLRSRGTVSQVCEFALCSVVCQSLCRKSMSFITFQYFVAFRMITF